MHSRPPEEQARHLYRPGMLAAVVTLGERGAAVATADETFSVRAFGVEAVDTVGAGDAFCAAMAVGTLRGLDIRETVRFACAAGALTVTREGASTALPSLGEVEALLSASGTGGSAA